MANAGRHTNNSQFFLTFKATPWLDGKHVVFGRVVGGAGLLKELEALGSKSGEPARRVFVSRCGPAIILQNCTLKILSSETLTVNNMEIALATCSSQLTILD